jgi:hypothetical protein
MDSIHSSMESLLFAKGEEKFRKNGTRSSIDIPLVLSSIIILCTTTNITDLY